MSNMLELANASFNFYMYCLCNKEIRLQVWSLLSLRFLRRRNISQQGHETSSTKQRISARVHRNPSELFPEVFNKKGHRRLSSFLSIRKKS